MFWKIEERPRDGAGSGPGDTPGLSDGPDGRALPYEALIDQAAACERAWAGGKALVAIIADNRPAAIVAYLGALRAGHAVLLANAATDDGLLRQVLEAYAPEYVAEIAGVRDWPGYRQMTSPVAGARVFAAARSPEGPIHPDLAVLLSTSGTTGSPKLVRLSHRNMQANAASIVRYLGIGPDEVAITSLPISYSYGLSVVNSHLLAGASLACTDAGVVEKSFWRVMEGRGCTSLAGVPVTYAMLERLKIERMNLPTLRTLTQAGGALDLERVRRFAQVARATGRRFFVMYGQTEATARIAYVPWDRLPDKIGSVGIAIPGGAVSIEGGEIVYAGPNVMMGYAASRADLARGDEMGGRLHTGDLGRIDAEGFVTVTGRLKRFLKMFGLRLNLDEVERMLEASLAVSVACVGRDDALRIVVETSDPAVARAAAERVSRLYGLHHAAIHAEVTAALPVTDSGKKDYKSLEGAAA